uniref:SKP1-like protein n=1 Tax=Anopheles atroparvus TaxID=41427 RepID=A0A182J1M4_ANOAO
MRTIQLISSDNEFFVIEEHLATLSEHIKACVEDADADETVLIFLPIHSAILSKVVQWANIHKDDLIPILDIGYDSDNDDTVEKCTNNIDPKDVDFLKDQKDILMDLGEAAVVLKMKKLTKVVCKTVANIIKNSKSVEEIRDTLNIKCDFTPAEEEQVRRENGFLGNI